MAEFTVNVGGKDYDVTAPDERTAWRWANQTHQQTIIPTQTKEASFPPRQESAADVMRNAPENMGSRVTDAAVRMGLPAEAAAAAGYGTHFLGNVGLELPEAVIGGGIGNAVGRLAAPAARRLMQSALKPSNADMLSGKGGRAIETMLGADAGNVLPGANVSRGGINSMQETATGLNNEVGAILQPSTATISRAGVYPPVQQALTRATNQVNPTADVAAIRDAWSEFVRHPSFQNLGAIPVQLANEIKSGTYQALGNRAYGELKGAQTEAQKALARGLRNEIERVEPAVAPLNARQSELHNALNVARRREATAGNKDPVNFAMLAHSPAAGLSMQASRSELVKSALARLLFNTGRPTATAAGGAAGAMYGQGDE